VTVASGATLGGAGQIARDLSVSGTIAPSAIGDSGVLRTNSTSFLSGGRLSLDFRGATPGEGAGFHDQLDVTGAVTIDAAATLALVPHSGFTAAAGQAYVIVKNDGVDAIVGTFQGLPEGASIATYFSGVIGTITYRGGDGNDIAILTPAYSTSVALDGAGNLVITDIDGGTSNDSLTIRADAASGRYLIGDPDKSFTSNVPGSTGNGTNQIAIPFSAVTGGTIQFETLAGDDAVTIDYALGAFPKPIVVNAGAQSTADVLTIANATLTNATLRLTGAGAGSIDADDNGAADVSYTGLELSWLSASVVNLTLDVVSPNTVDAVIRDYSGAGDAGHSELAFTGHSAVDARFKSPTGSLTLLTHGGATTTLSGFDSGFAPTTLTLSDSSATRSDLKLVAGERIPNSTAVSLVGQAALDLNGFVETIGALTGTGIVDNRAGGPATLQVTVASGSSTFGGTLRDTGGDLAINKLGAGTWVLSGASSSLSGATTVVGGTLQLNGSLPSSAVTVRSGATLTGAGGTGRVTVDAGGVHAPGSGVGVVNIAGNYVMNGELRVDVGFGGSGGAGVGFDQVRVVGTVTIGAAATLTANYLGSAGSFLSSNIGAISFVDNDGADAIVGTFSNDTVAIDGKQLTITYEAFDGNNVGLRTDQLDHGDAPSSYGDASHRSGGPRLGARVDIESEAAAGSGATGDDGSLGAAAAGSASGDDEDGVQFLVSSLPVSATSSTRAAVAVELQNAASALLDAWFDFNQDGDWEDPGEQ
ncbi:MAG TPA: autotransporter-associated beta strand repeat-containing protein, partial [Pirellulaceae bacterium]|nr:autotransporter-associated beta strand repeat-containing protein [Pirellulaceae bacterium]